MESEGRAYDITTERIDAQPIAVVKTEAHSQNIGGQIGRLLPVVEKRLKAPPGAERGRPLVLYFDDEQGRSFFEPPGLRVHIGFEVSSPLTEETEAVSASSLPAGRVATTLHVGPYWELFHAHEAIRKWCRDEGLTITGVNWERYGDHEGDPEKLRTEVFYALSE
jgi:effector-binding domain-containing protein